MKKVIAVLFALILAGGAGGGVYYYFYYNNKNLSSERQSSTSSEAIYVNSVAELAGLGSGSGRIQRFAGVVEPQQTWDAKLGNDRTVKDTYVKEGDEVKKGDRIFTYNTSEDEDKLEEAKIELERAQNDIQTAQATLERLEREQKRATADEQLGYTTSILSTQNEIKQSEYKVKTTELEIKQLQQTIKDADVFSELTGVVKSIASSGSSSSMSDSNSDVYLTIMAVGAFRIKGTVNEQNISSIYEGQPFLAFSRVDSSLVWKGTLSEIKKDAGTSNSSDDYYSSDSSTSSSNYPFYVDLDSSEGLMLGQHVYLEPDSGQADQKSGIWLPDYYFIQEGEDFYVWAASESNLLEKRKVTTGEYDDNMWTYEVLDGLAEDDYITIPSEDLKEGLPVSYIDYSAADFGSDGIYADDSFEEDGEDGDTMDWDMIGGADNDFDNFGNDFGDDDFGDDFEDDDFGDDEDDW